MRSVVRNGEISVSHARSRREIGSSPHVTAVRACRGRGEASANRFDAAKSSRSSCTVIEGEPPRVRLVTVDGVIVKTRRRSRSYAMSRGPPAVGISGRVVHDAGEVAVAVPPDGDIGYGRVDRREQVDVALLDATIDR